MKKKLANLLRRWASKLSPDNTTSDRVLTAAMTSRTTADVKIFRAAHHYTRRDLQALEHDPDLAPVMEMDARRKLLHDIALAMYQAGAITFHTEPEGCPDSHDVLIATCRAVVKK
ncbi:MAG: hypothetical protein J6C44_06465 [Muribaculaceae bacterium]|nr:hypothetical protein [Muribaculaceae bacterium]MBO5187457.1 hypothetical protein [Prevotella sp.]